MEHAPRPHTSESIPTPEYWEGNKPFKSPRKYYELQFEFAKLMAERTGMTLVDAVDAYAPVMRNHIHTFDEDWNITGLEEGITDENMLEKAWEKSLVRHVERNSEPTEYHPEGSRFGCHYYDYDEASKTINIHFFNAEFEEEWEEGKDVSKGPLDSSKLDRRMHELTDMFKDIKKRYPDAERVRCQSSLNNLNSYLRLYPESYRATVGDIDYDPKLWAQGTTVWGQFLGGNEKAAGEYGFKEELVTQFLDKVKELPVEKLPEALPNPVRTAEAPIQDFYEMYGVK